MSGAGANDSQFANSGTEPSGGTVDAAEIARFNAMAADWWDPTGKFRPLHKFNPVRLAYIKQQVSARFARDDRAANAFEGLKFLDIGCGGGLLCEPMARLGADVTGADASSTNTGIASVHAEQSGLAIDYRATTAEALAENGEQYDVVLNMEVVEHVADVPLYLNACARLVKPGGLMFVATINRTLKAYALAIVGAEYVLGWLPKGTHTYEKLVRPEEIEGPLVAAGLTPLERCGVSFNPLADEWRRSRDLDVNYMMLFGRDHA